MATRAQLTGQDLIAEPAVSPAGPCASGGDVPAGTPERLTTAGAAYAAARAALDAALPPGWRRAAVESLPTERAVLADDSSSAA